MRIDTKKLYEDLVVVLEGPGNRLDAAKGPVAVQVQENSQAIEIFIMDVGVFCGEGGIYGLRINKADKWVQPFGVRDYTSGVHCSPEDAWFDDLLAMVWEHLASDWTWYDSWESAPGQ